MTKILVGLLSLYRGLSRLARRLRRTKPRTRVIKLREVKPLRS